MSRKYLAVESRGPVALVTINHPPRNFLRAGMLYELNDLLDEFNRDGARAVVITGGSRTTSSPTPTSSSSATPSPRTRRPISHSGSGTGR